MTTISTPTTRNCRYKIGIGPFPDGLRDFLHPRRSLRSACTCSTSIRA